jgi:hypothetical protein
MRRGWRGPGKGKRGSEDGEVKKRVGMIHPVKIIIIKFHCL